MKSIKPYIITCKVMSAWSLLILVRITNAATQPKSSVCTPTCLPTYGGFIRVCVKGCNPNTISNSNSPTQYQMQHTMAQQRSGLTWIRCYHWFDSNIRWWTQLTFSVTALRLSIDRKLTFTCYQTNRIDTVSQQLQVNSLKLATGKVHQMT